MAEKIAPRAAFERCVSPRCTHADVSLVDELEIVAVLVQLRDVLAVAPDALLRQQDVGQHHLAELRLADEAAIVVGIGRLDVDMHVDVADGVAPGGIALGLRQTVRREDEVHGFLHPWPASDRLAAA